MEALFEAMGHFSGIGRAPPLGASLTGIRQILETHPLQVTEPNGASDAYAKAVAWNMTYQDVFNVEQSIDNASFTTFMHIASESDSYLTVKVGSS